MSWVIFCTLLIVGLLFGEQRAKLKYFVGLCHPVCATHVCLTHMCARHLGFIKATLEQHSSPTKYQHSLNIITSYFWENKLATTKKW